MRRLADVGEANARKGPEAEIDCGRGIMVPSDGRLWMRSCSHRLKVGS